MDLLLRYKIIYSNPRNTSKYSLIMSRNKFRSNPPNGMTQSITRQIENDFALCMTLAHGLELLSQHGLRNLYRYLKNLFEDKDGSNPIIKARLSGNGKLTDLLAVLEERLGETDLQEPDLNTTLGVTQTQTAPKVYSHPKMEKLRDVIINHFQTFQLKGEETRVMVFCQYRDTVVEVCHLLARLKPLVKVMSFVGQSTGKLNKGLSQKQQLLIMEKFRRGGYNTLISTSIGEEGLDIGEVDLIICYDAHASPIRLVQRMGRTGRKRNGHIVMLLTEGKESKKYQQSLCNKKSMNAVLVNSKQFLKFFYPSPRMVPSDFEPECYKMFMSMPKTSRDRDVRKMLINKKSSSSKVSGISKDFDLEDYEKEIPPDLLYETEFLHSMEADELLKWQPNPQKIDFSSDLDWLLNDNETKEVARSSVAKDFQELLEFAARRRCDVPLTQTATLASQVCRNELWPSKKRKKGVGVNSKGPQKKKKNFETPITELADKKKKQRRLSNLWTAISETQDDFVSNDADLMPPPMMVPAKKKKLIDDIFSEESNILPQDCDHVILNSDNTDDDNTDDHLPAFDAAPSPEFCEEDAVDVLSENLIMTEEMISKLKALEDGTVLCCRFSEMFHKSELSSFLIGPVHEIKVNKSVKVTPLPDSGYFDELLNPEVWRNFKKKYENFDAECEKSACLSPILSPGKLRKKSWDNLITDKHFPDQYLRVSQKEADNDSLLIFRNEYENLNKGNTYLEKCDLKDSSPEVQIFNESPTIPSGKFKIRTWNDFISDDLFSEEDLLTDINLKNTTNESQSTFKYEDTNISKNEDSLNKCSENFSSVKISRCSEENRQAFDIGITQLLSISPDLIEDAANTVTGEHFSCVETNEVLTQKTDIKKNMTQSKQMGIHNQNQNYLEETPAIPSKKSRVRFVEHNDPKLGDSNLNDVLTQETKADSQTSTPKSNDLANLSTFVDEAILKWLGSSEDDNDFSSSPDRIENMQENISEAPLSPIISSQRKVAVISKINSSTPKPKPKPKPLFSRHNKANVSNHSNNSASHSPRLINEIEIFDDHSSLDDFEISDVVKQKNTSKVKKKREAKSKEKKEVQDVSGAGAVFIQDEAEESREDRRSSSDGENTSGLDELDDSFVDDEETAAHDSVDIQAQYLQSVRSPGNCHGKFKIKDIQNFQGNIYSQALTEEELCEDYEQDSFCVSGSEEALSNSSVEDTLEIIEAALKKRRKRSTRTPPKKNNRKRIRVASSSSSNEESDVLKNLHFTQVVKEPSSKLNNSHEKGKFAADSHTSTVKNAAIKSAPLSDSIGENNDIPSDFWDDEECFLMNDDNFLDCAMIGNSEKIAKPSGIYPENKIIELDDEPEFVLPKQISKSNPKSKNESTSVRKNLNFCNSKSNADKKTLLTHFFGRSDSLKNQERKSANTSSGRECLAGSSTNFSGAKEKRRKYSSGDYCEDIEQKKERTMNESSSEEKLTVIASSRQVTSAPEVITALKSRHRIFVLVHPIHVAHFIVSPQVGVIRISLKDFCGGPKTTPLLETARNLTSLFQQAHMIVEYTPSAPEEKPLWPPHCIKLTLRLRTVGIKVLYSDSKAATADILANLCCREFSCGRHIKLPVSVRASTAVVQFLEATGVNIAIAFNACFSFKTLKHFINSCKSVPEIRQKLGVNREVARKIYYRLHDVL